MGVLISLEQFQTTVSDEQTCLILNSRQSKRPCGADEWVAATKDAISHYSSRESLFLTSIGMNSWELTVHLVNILGGRQIIVIPTDLTEYGYFSIDDFLRSFRLDEERTSLLILNSSKDQPSEEWPQARDEFLFASARILVSVSVRPSGRLQSLLANSNGIVDSSFRTHYRKPTDRVHYDWNGINLNPRVGDGWDGLTHWTRSGFSPLETGDHFDFYSAILESKGYPFSALHILERILQDGRILASSRFIRGGYPVVSLTAQSPIDAIKLMRWRKRYAYYSFEPYGISIDASFAHRLGIRPVSYGTVADFDSLPEPDRPFFQNAGSEVAEWRPEAEWRHVGDLNLRDIPPEMMRVYTYRESEIEGLRALSPCEVVSLTIGD